MEIMATTTNNHNQNELRSYAVNEQQQQTANAVTLINGAESPFQREVREWQRIDPDTGALLTGRLEADRWINGPLNKYGKISDSQNISQPNGTQQTQRKQLEVLQTCTPSGGAMQVIRSQTVQTTSSRWSTSSASASPLLLSASTSPVPQVHRNNKNNFKQKTHHNSTNSCSSTTNLKTNNHTTSLLTNGFDHHHHHQHHHNHHNIENQLDQLRQQHAKLQQFPNSLVNGFSNNNSHNRHWPDLTKNMSTLDICDNGHDHYNDYIIEQQSSDDEQNNHNGNDNDNDHDSLIDYNDTIRNNDEYDNDEHTKYLLNKCNNLKNFDFIKRHSFTVFTNNNDKNNNINCNANNYDCHDHHDSHHHHHKHNHSHNNLSRDSSNCSCNNNNNQLFLLDTAPSIKLSNLMKSSSSLSNNSNNSTTASQTTTATTMNTHESMANKISLHSIVDSSSKNNSGYSNNNDMKTAIATSSTPSPILTTKIARPSWQQPTLYRQNSTNNKHNRNNENITHSHLMKSRVGDNNNCCSRSSSDGSSHSGSSYSDESRQYAAKTETDLRHLQQHQHHQQQQQRHIKQNDRLTPTHSPHSYHRVDLESFRHYNNNGNTNNNNNNNNNDNGDDDGLRLSKYHLRKQQSPVESSVVSLQRSRSISTDDLSTEWDIQGYNSEEPAEWRRVSKIRRSFQSSTKTNQSLNSPTTIRRPLDLPTNSVSVSKIRAELENGRRLNTVMRNNHVDLAALSSILNSNTDKENKSSITPKRSSFLTAESLKEIRGKLKKLSDESLYKEDFVISQQNNGTNPEVEHIVNDQTKIKTTYAAAKSPEYYRVATTAEEPTNSLHNSNSLESRVKYKDTNSIDWHNRRKSYGFEKMSPPEKATLRMDASTDSGLGRSGELQNWSPTSEAASTNRTVVHFGETTNVNKTPVIQRRYTPHKFFEESDNLPEEDLAVSKRHSIAVDESQYVRDNARQTTQIHLNGFYEPESYSKLMHFSESTTTSDRGQQKRVEFSKTEVHFATESGRVNIVETDSKPPPTNNFRRRKSRSSSVGPLQSLVKSATTISTTSSIASDSNTAEEVMPVPLFGNDNSKKKPIASTTLAYRSSLVNSPETAKETGTNVTVTVPSYNNSFAFTESSRNIYASTGGVDTTDCDTDEMTSLRGILKNKPTKPKPYVLGENIDKPDQLWGVHLKPVSSNQTKTEKVYKSESPTLLTSLPQKSVAERIQELGSATSTTQSNGFSTKINVSLGSSSVATKNWEETGLITTINRKPSVQEILLHDLKEHQKILDEGLKSTTLIMKTMRSATEFDEAMRRLSLASIKAAVIKPTPVLRSNSYQESSHSPHYIEPNTEGMENIYKSSCSTMAFSRKYSLDSRKTSTESGTSCTLNDFTTRLNFLDNEQIPVSLQLQRLRMIYDTAANRSQDEDSADEEVKSYFRGQVDSDSGGGTQDSSSYEDDHCLEPVNSWSHLKTKKTIWKIDMDNNSGDRSLMKTLDKTDLPKSNIMSIKLHSPQATNEVHPPLKIVSPIAKPRTITIQETQPQKIHTTNTVKQASYPTNLPTTDSLKIVKESRGARQLREHELSYFGIPVSTSEDEKPKSKYTTISSFRNSPKRSLPLRKLSEETSIVLQPEQEEQWQLGNDKPDLLKHNPVEIKPTERTSLKKKAELDKNEEHLYENIANDITPVFKVKVGTPIEQYDRKMDLERDAMILSEMNQNADQTLKELSEEAALKDRRRRSLQRRNSKPLETIDEKSIAERIDDSCILVKISRATYSSEAKKTSRHSTPSPTGIKGALRERSSSQSSVECCPRARSRSLSSEKEYDIKKSKPSKATQIVKHKTSKLLQSRSSSLDSHRSTHSQYSSSEEHQQQQQHRSAGSFRREDRSRAKTKRITNLASISSRDKHRDEKATRLSSTQHHHHGDSKLLSSTTHSSTHRERVGCKHDNSTGSKTSTQYYSNSSGLQRSTALSSSVHHPKDDLRNSQHIKRSSITALGRSASERHGKHEQVSSEHATRSLHDDEKNSSQRSSAHRLERADKEKEKTSRSKGHSSHSTSRHHRERSTNPEKHTSTKETKTKSAQNNNTTSSKNAQQHHASKERHDRQHQHKSKRDEDQTEHVHSLKSAIIKNATKLRDKSRAKKEVK